jgi:hypothetical protein
VDSGATNNFINSKFIEKHMVPTITKSEPRKLSVVDRHEINSGAITEEVTETFNFGDVACRMTIDVSNTGNDDTVLGTPWFEDLGIVLDFNTKSFVFKKAGNPKRLQPWKQEVERVHFNHRTEVYSLTTDKLKTEKKDDRTPEEVVPSDLHEFLDVFSLQSADKLPAFRGGNGDMAIDFKEGTDVSKLRGPTYQKTGIEKQAESDYVDEMLKKGHIRKSELPIGALVIFVKKKDGKLRFCIDL